MRCWRNSLNNKWKWMSPKFFLYKKPIFLSQILPILSVKRIERVSSNRRPHEDFLQRVENREKRKAKDGNRLSDGLLETRTFNSSL